MKVWLAMALVVLLSPSAFATAGFAEWELPTPGGNTVSDSDPSRSEHGVCLRAQETVFVSYLAWWQFYRGKVVGQAKTGFFIFDEKTKRVELVSESMLKTRVRAFGRPLSRRMTPQDGYDEQFHAICVQLKNAKKGEISDEVRARFAPLCEKLHD